MEGFLIGIGILVILVNISAIILLFKFKQTDTQMMEDETAAIHQNMESFVHQIEQENDELYQKLVTYIKEKEAALDERIRKLDEKLASDEQYTADIETIKPDKLDLPYESHLDQESNDQAYQNVSKLFRQGFSAKQIAKVLKIDRGEVELIINMYQKQQRFHK